MGDVGSEDDHLWIVVEPRAKKAAKQKSLTTSTRRKNKSNENHESADTAHKLEIAVERAFKGLVTDSRAPFDNSTQQDGEIRDPTPIECSFRRFCIVSWEALFCEDSPSFSFRGLRNDGNTCFRNCILQCLFRNETFRRVVYSLNSTAYSAVVPSTLSGWREMINFGAFLGENSLRSSKRFGSSSISVSESLSLLCSKFDHFIRTQQPATEAHKARSEGKHGSLPTIVAQGANQQDAMEFYTFILNELDEECYRAAASPVENEEVENRFQQLVAQEIHSMEQLLLCGLDDLGSDRGEWEQVSRRGTRIKSVVDNKSSTAAVTEFSQLNCIRYLYHGLLRCEVTYRSSKKSSITFQRFHCLSLPLSRVGRRRSPAVVDLDELIQDYFAPEDLSEGKIRKLVQFARLPHTLVFHISRFYFDHTALETRKVNDKVRFPSELRLPLNTLSDNLRERGSLNLFRLQSAVLHHGSRANGGHYTSVISPVSGSMEWIQMDDETVRPVNLEKMLSASSEVYILFYVQVKPQ